MQGILYEEPSFGLFVLITCIIGGWAAWMTGRACAQTWRPYGIFLLYLLPLTAMVRFIHYAMFEGTLLSLHYYLVDLVVLAIIGSKFRGTDLVGIYAAMGLFWGAGALFGPTLAGLSMDITIHGLPIFVGIACAVFLGFILLIGRYAKNMDEVSS